MFFSFPTQFPRLRSAFGLAALGNKKIYNPRNLFIKKCCFAFPMAKKKFEYTSSYFLKSLRFSSKNWPVAIEKFYLSEARPKAERSSELGWQKKSEQKKKVRLVLRFLSKSNGWTFETVEKVVFLTKIANLKF